MVPKHHSTNLYSCTHNYICISYMCLWVCILYHYMWVYQRSFQNSCLLSGSQGTLMYSVGSAIDGFCGCVNPKCFILVNILTQDICRSRYYVINILISSWYSCAVQYRCCMAGVLLHRCYLRAQPKDEVCLLYYIHPVTTCAVHVEGCEGWWFSNCHSSVAEHWQFKPGVLGLISGSCWLLLYFHLMNLSVPSTSDCIFRAFLCCILTGNATQRLVLWVTAVI